MIVYDPLYGKFETPEFLDSLIMSPEVRRLAEVRLLNAPTPSLATLSEIRRLSHTLGVIYLALQNPMINLSRDEVRAFLAAILIHDAATPPFAHLLEYYLKDQFGWDHESAIAGMLTGHNVPGNLAFQVLPGEAIKYRPLCERSGVDFDMVLAIVSKSHPVSQLLFGTIDFDNLDNVIRMNWALGMRCDTKPFLELARNLRISLTGKLLLSQDYESAVVTWAMARNAAYEIVVFDERASAAQAVLTRAIRLLLADSDARQSDRIRMQRDQDLVDLLRKSPATKSFMISHFAHLPRLIFCERISGTLSSLGFDSRDAAIDWLEQAVTLHGGVSNPIGYVFADKGAFSKRLCFEDPGTRHDWQVGTTSQSVIFYCFAGGSGRVTHHSRSQLNTALHNAICALGRSHAHESTAAARLTSWG